MTASLPPFFHIYLNIFFCCHLGLISDLSDREAVEK